MVYNHLLLGSNEGMIGSGSQHFATVSDIGLLEEGNTWVHVYDQMAMAGEVMWATACRNGHTQVDGRPPAVLSQHHHCSCCQNWCH